MLEEPSVDKSFHAKHPTLRALKEWLRNLSGSEVNGTATASATYFAPGDTMGAHTDTEVQELNGLNQSSSTFLQPRSHLHFLSHGLSASLFRPMCSSRHQGSVGDWLTLST